ncbi:hypothetical protein HPB50_021116 [Hyalomma asiaticum]|uniref:Uncharacterized protein n=1 Tax=Hyalomma asiaticum TaxID=266040 RepID=A0ACB7TNM0_HYAAI|nr:hypothetical protein HPB50_021116 [Hyalomma asiaticum]
MRYVTELTYDPDTKEFNATTLSLLNRKKHISFIADDVKVPTIPGPFTTLLAKGRPLFVEVQNFQDAGALEHLMGPISKVLLATHDFHAQASFRQHRSGGAETGNSTIFQTDASLPRYAGGHRIAGSTTLSRPTSARPAVLRPRVVIRRPPRPTSAAPPSQLWVEQADRAQASQPRGAQVQTSHPRTIQDDASHPFDGAHNRIGGSFRLCRLPPPGPWHKAYTVTIIASSRLSLVPKLRARSSRAYNSGPIIWGCRCACPDKSDWGLAALNRITGLSLY